MAGLVGFKVQVRVGGYPIEPSNKAVVLLTELVSQSLEGIKKGESYALLSRALAESIPRSGAPGLVHWESARS